MQFFKCCSRNPNRHGLHSVPLSEPESPFGAAGGAGPHLPLSLLDREQDASSRRLVLDPIGEGRTLQRQARGAPTTMIISLIVLIFEGTVYNLVFLNRLLPALGLTGRIIPFMLMFNLFWGMALWSYLCAHLADPGVVPESWRSFVAQAGQGLTVVTARLEWQPGKATMCKRCECPRPERTHHCHVCGVCVLRMDHHCPWINNCVGFRNYKQFLLLVAYCILSALVALVTSAPQLLACTTELWRLVSNTPEEGLGLELGDIVTALVFGIVALVFLALLLPMFGTHTVLAVQNMTSIESHYDDEYVRNPFDLRSAIANLEQVLGVRGWDWLLPIEPRQQLSDGIAFRRFGESLGAADLLAEAESSPKAMQREMLWRMNYGVRSVDQLEEQKPEFSPLTHLVQWWKQPIQERTDESTSRERSESMVPLKAPAVVMDRAG